MTEERQVARSRAERLAILAKHPLEAVRAAAELALARLASKGEAEPTPPKVERR